MESTDSAAGHPSPQAVLTKTRKLYNAVQTKEAYDQAIPQRGLEAVEADITAVMADLCHLIASASDPQVRAEG
ncbi:unnamed protein product [Vitrella brassicaformis CCMP3155]|uniref:Uncharacterized protein n=1 Tax=Vitrella brassicaformis (strain CCMP3155) TaxID=1169540 RepID=A0A0G4GJ07_VITBC|nr:unnamed protein product [Vitrella brassicaformis CCMP3155]|eukprot:CEM29748.1 unnamed protein product [Vitrella brassicaformis CCMP3155]